MIIQNGTIEIKSKSVSGIDPETGYPTKPISVEWSDPIPCQFSANKYDKLGRVNGEHFTIASYTILVEMQSMPNVEQIRLKGMDGKAIGEYSVIDIEPLEAVCELRITV